MFDYNLYMNDEHINSTLKNIHVYKNSFDEDNSVKAAAERCRFMRMFPEDYVDGDYSAEELYSQLCEIKSGFESLYDIFGTEE